LYDKPDFIIECPTMTILSWWVPHKCSEKLFEYWWGSAILHDWWHAFPVEPFNPPASAKDNSFHLLVRWISFDTAVCLDSSPGQAANDLNVTRCMEYQYIGWCESVCNVSSGMLEITEFAWMRSWKTDCQTNLVT
jgi:hypothetical protein